MPKQPDYPVMIPYSELVELLDVTKEVKAYKQEVQRLNQQLLSVRIIQQQCMDRIRELQKLL